MGREGQRLVIIRLEEGRHFNRTCNGYYGRGEGGKLWKITQLAAGYCGAQVEDGCETGAAWLLHAVRRPC